MRLFIGLVSLCCVLAEDVIPTRTIVDVLSSRTEFSELISLLQHHELIPFLNDVWNSTFLAPVNSAFIGLDKDTITRDQLLYHLVNSTVRSTDIADTTKLYHSYLDHGKAPISLSLEHGVNSKVEFDEMDMLASAQRGVVHALPRLLNIPKTLAKQLYLNPESAAFSSIVDEDLLSKGATVLVPKTQAFQRDLANHASLSAADPLLNYLRSSYGKADRKKLVERHISLQIPFDQSFPMHLTLMDRGNATLFANSTLRVDGMEVDYDCDIHVARNGVYLELNGIVATQKDPLLTTTAEKIMLGMGGYDMVKGITLYGLRHMIDRPVSNAKANSIVVPRGNITYSKSPNKHHKKHHSPKSGNVSYPMTIAEKFGLRANGNEVSVMTDSPNLIKYHFIKGILATENSSKLLDTMMPLRSNKYSQRVHFERSQYDTSTLNWEIIDDVSYQWGDTTFYSAADLISAPQSLLMALGPLMSSSHSIAFLDKLDRLQLPMDKSWTVFLPTRDAWDKNALLLQYLDSNEKSLEIVFNNLIYQAPIYTDSGVVKADHYSGERTEVAYDAEYREFTIKNDHISAQLTTENADVLFDNGVAHIVNDVPLPVDLEITAEDLIRAGGRHLFIDLLEAADMAEVLDPASNFTVLVPPSKDLRHHNFTKHTDKKKLRAMLALHLIPGKSLGKFFDGEQAATLAGEDLEIHALDPAERFFSISPSSATNGQRVLILEYGYTNGKVANGAGVIFVDRYIAPEWIIPIKFGLHKGTYAAVGILVGILVALSIIFSMLAFCVRQPANLDFPDDPEYRDIEENAENGDSDQTITQPIETPAVAEDRAHGRHLNLPN